MQEKVKNKTLRISHLIEEEEVTDTLQNAHAYGVFPATMWKTDDEIPFTKKMTAKFTDLVMIWVFVVSSPTLG